MKDIGFLRYFLGLEVWKGAHEVFLQQGKYIVEIFEEISKFDYKPSTTPMVPNLKLTCVDLADPTL
jgi:hypothetical protein